MKKAAMTGSDASGSLSSIGLVLQGHAPLDPDPARSLVWIPLICNNKVDV
jgi:hypothetical protein